jgi:hypothetical protein
MATEGWREKKEVGHADFSRLLGYLYAPGPLSLSWLAPILSHRLIFSSFLIFPRLPSIPILLPPLLDYTASKNKIKKAIILHYGVC